MAKTGTMTEYEKRYDDNGGFGHWVQGSRKPDETHICKVQCYRITSYDVDHGTIESSELLVEGTIMFDGRANFEFVEPQHTEPAEAERVGLAMVRCYEAAVELLGIDRGDWDWKPAGGGWRSHPYGKQATQ